MSLFEKMKRKTQKTLAGEAESNSPVLKGCSVRLLPEYINLIDALADKLDENRQAFLSSLIYDAVDEALDGYASVFEKPAEVKADILSECGFVYGKSTISQFTEFCQLNHLDPDDSNAMNVYRDAVDYVNGRYEEHE